MLFEALALMVAAAVIGLLRLDLRATKRALEWVLLASCLGQTDRRSDEGFIQMAEYDWPHRGSGKPLAFKPAIKTRLRSLPGAGGVDGRQPPASPRSKTAIPH